MAESRCACQQFARLQGAAAQAYSASFLERVAGDEPSAALYRCRECGTRWRKVETEGEKRASLLRLEDDDASSQCGSD
ncbi:MAG: hypothetical protein U0Z53_05980 [Blastocatellia bacterium]